MVICLEQGADLHVAQLMPLPLTVSCVSKIQIGVTFLVPAYTSSPEKGPLNGCLLLLLLYITNSILQYSVNKQRRMDRLRVTNACSELTKGLRNDSQTDDVAA